jgi:hypothetical protein
MPKGGGDIYLVPIEVPLCPTIGFVPVLRVYRVTSNKYPFPPSRLTVYRTRPGFLECCTLIRQWTESNLNKDNKPLSRKINKYTFKCDACVFSASGDDIGYCEVIGCGLPVIQPVLARDVGWRISTHPGHIVYCKVQCWWTLCLRAGRWVGTGWNVLVFGRLKGQETSLCLSNYSHRTATNTQWLYQKLH